MNWSGYMTAPAEAGFSPLEGALYCSPAIDRRAEVQEQVVRQVYESRVV